MEDNYNKANQVIFRYCSALIGKKKTGSNDSDGDLSHKKVYQSTGTGISNDFWYINLSKKKNPA